MLLPTAGSGGGAATARSVISQDLNGKKREVACEKLLAILREELKPRDGLAGDLPACGHICLRRLHAGWAAEAED